MMTAKNPKRVLKVLATNKLMPQWDIAQKLLDDKAQGQEQDRGQDHRDIYPRVHEAIAYLERYGLVKVYQEEKSARGMPKKMYGLTFYGVVEFLSTASFKAPARFVEGESEEERVQRRRKEKEQRYYEFMKLVSFLRFYGELLDYALFKEVCWLFDLYGPVVIYDILDAAKHSEVVLSGQPVQRLLMFDLFDDFFAKVSETSELAPAGLFKSASRDRDWGEFLRYLRQKCDAKSSPEYSPRSRFRGKIKLSRDEKDARVFFHDLFVPLHRLLSPLHKQARTEILRKTLQILASYMRDGHADSAAVADLQSYLQGLAGALEKERQQWEEENLRRTFTARFASRFQNAMPRSPQRSEEQQNKALSKLFSQTAADIRQIEVEPSEKLAQTFKTKG